MISYASNTGTRRNLDQFRRFGWRILLTPENPLPRRDIRFAIDNGAWSCFQKKLEFDDDGFKSLIEAYGSSADFVVIPDIVCGGKKSMDFSLSWLDYLRHFRLILFPVQDGMDARDVGAILERNPNMGLFLGGSTEWKLDTMQGWGMVAHSFRRWYHVGRVNSRKRIRMAHHCGADSIDGTSGTLYSMNVPRLDGELRQSSLLSPKVIN